MRILRKRSHSSPRKPAVFKLAQDRDKGDGLGTFEALETLGLGIQGKATLWRALFVISQQDNRVRGTDYQQLGKRAEEQHARVETLRASLLCVPSG